MCVCVRRTILPFDNMKDPLPPPAPSPFCVCFHRIRYDLISSFICIIIISIQEQSVLYMITKRKEKKRKGVRI